MIASTNRFSEKYGWLLLSVAAIVFVMAIPYSSLFFLNDDFTSIPVYSCRDFTYGLNTRIIPAVSMYTDHLLYGKRASGYIITNVLLHIACCFAGYAWYMQIARSFSVVLPQSALLMATLLFMWFGFHSEVLLWMICRTTSISLLLFFGAWACFFRLRQSYSWLVPAFLMVTAGLFSYEVLLLLPVQIVAWYYLAGKQTSWKVATSALAVTLVAIGCYYGVKYIITHRVGENYGAEHFTGLHIGVLVKNYCSLLIRTVAPPLANKWLVVGAGTLLMLALGAMAFRLLRQKKWDALWKFLLFNWLSGYLIFSSLGIDLSGNESDRYLYIPSFFFCAWLAYSIYLLVPGRVLQILIFLLILLYQAGYLFVSINNFKKAGKLANDALYTIHQNQGAAGTQVENLPSKAYGIPVLRSGVKNGLKWLYPDTDTAKITIASQMVLPAGNAQSGGPFVSIYFDTTQGVNVIHFFRELP